MGNGRFPTLHMRGRLPKVLCICTAAGRAAGHGEGGSFSHKAQAQTIYLRTASCIHWPDGSVKARTQLETRVQQLNATPNAMGCALVQCDLDDLTTALAQHLSNSSSSARYLKEHHGLDGWMVLLSQYLWMTKLHESILHNLCKNMTSTKLTKAPPHKTSAPASSASLSRPSACLQGVEALGLESGELHPQLRQHRRQLAAHLQVEPDVVRSQRPIGRKPHNAGTKRVKVGFIRGQGC